MTQRVLVLLAVTSLLAPSGCGTNATSAIDGGAGDLSAAGDLAGTCPGGQKSCGKDAMGQLRCVPASFCCGDSDCPAMGQSCQADGTCGCPKGQVACDKMCVIGACCIDADCPTLWCVKNACMTPACGDGIRNGKETDVDCGGDCAPCGLNRSCAKAADCRSNVCTASVCVLPTFSLAAYGGGNGPVHLAAADIDGDGKLDVVSANQRSGAVSVLLGSGDGNLRPPTSFLAGAGPVTVLTGDFDKDARIDVASVDGDQNQGGDVAVLLNAGLGALKPGVPYGVGPRPTWGVSADLNGDTVLDLATASSFGSVSVLLGKGGGSFATQVTYPVGPSAAGLAAADLNGDGRLDLVTVNSIGQQLVVMTGDATLGFLPPVAVPIPLSGTSLATGDIDGDGRPDVVVGSGSGGSVLKNSKSGLSLTGSIGGQANLSQVVLADINGDKKLDLVASDGVALGNGNGTFLALAAFPLPRVQSIAVGDFNRDKVPDVAVTIFGSDLVAVLVGKGDGTFAMPGPGKGNLTDLKLIAPTAVQLADLNGDGRADLVGAGDSRLLWVQLANVDGSLAPAVTYPTCDGPVAVTVGDFNEDRLPDVIVGCANDSPALYSGWPQGALTRVNLKPPGIPAPNLASLASADLDHDGHLDLAFADATSLAVAFGNGDGSFRARVSRGLGGAGVKVLRIADLDGDGNLDVAGARTEADLWLNRGSDHAGGIALASPFAAARQVSVVGVADVNGDQAIDAVVGGANRSVDVLLSTKLGIGMLGFMAPMTHPVASPPSMLVLGDVDKDGKPDVLTASTMEATLTVLLSGQALGPVNADLSPGPVAIAVGDINGDGKLDVAIANQTARTFTVMLNKL